MTVIIATMFSAIVVFFVLLIVAYGMFKVSPFAHHAETYRDPHTRRKLGESPHLETRDEFERGPHGHPA